jgi:hypothetical protein
MAAGKYLGRAGGAPTDDSMETITMLKTILAAALIVGTASAALASDNSSGDYHGGFVTPGSTDGVNPAYHPDLFANHANGSRAYGYAGGRGVYAATRPGAALDYANGQSAYGSANAGRVTSHDGAFVNGNFIPRGTSPAQVPAFHEED